MRLCNPLFSTLLLIFAGVITTHASPPVAGESYERQVAKRYFQVYKERKDFDQFMSFYAENAQLTDVIFGNIVKGKPRIRQFFDWERGQFKALSGDGILTVTEQTIDDKKLVTEGYFHRFSYDGQTLGPWLFIIKQELDSDGKIINQVDWINYTPREQFSGGQNINEKLSKD